MRHIKAGKQISIDHEWQLKNDEYCKFVFNILCAANPMPQ